MYVYRTYATGLSCQSGPVFCNAQTDAGQPIALLPGGQAAYPLASFLGIEQWTKATLLSGTAS